MNKQWTKVEVEYLKKHYPINFDKDLSNKLKRSLKAISYMACKLKLRKTTNFYEQARKRSGITISKSTLQKLYLGKKKSIRKISKELGVSKTTIEYYFKKYNLSTRTRSDANVVRFLQENNWMKGLNKNKDVRINKLAKNIKKTYEKKRKEKFKRIEEEHGMNMKDLLYNLYWKKNLTQQKISEKLGICRNIIINLMKELKVAKKPNFEFISSLKGKDHSMYGKTWEDLFGYKKSLLLKKQYSIRSRKLMIKRLQNNEIPFMNTRIEKLVAKEMAKRKLPFKSQFVIDNKFVCDFAISKHKIIIECDGDYWHANPKIYDLNNLDIRQKRNIKKDVFKKKYLIK